MHKDIDKQDLTIIEYANLDKELLTVIGKEVHQEDTITKAIAKGENALIALLRTKNMFFPGILAHKIAESIKMLYERPDDQYAEIYFDESDFIHGIKRHEGEKTPLEKGKAPVENFPDGDFENAFIADRGNLPEIKVEELELIEAENEYQEESDSLEEDLDLFDDEDDDV